MFVASIGALLVLSIPDLRPAPYYNSEFYLENIYQALAGSDELRTPITSTVTKPRAPPFSPPRYAVWVNSLWSLSFVISLSCGLLATLVQQWARRFMRNTHPRHCSLEKQARMRTLFANGADNMYTSRVIEGMTSLLHFSALLFLVGFAIYLFNINYTASRSMIWWIALSSTVYGCISLVPIFRPDTPYYTPLSAPVWSLYTGMRYVISECLTSDTNLSKNTLWGFGDTSNPYFRWFWGGVEEAAGDAAMSSRIELEILDRSVGVLRGSNERERFFELIPRFFKSKLERVLPTDVPLTLRTKFRKALNEFLDHTLSSDSVSQSDKTRRLVIGLNAMHVIPGPDSVSEILQDILKGRWAQVSQLVWVNTLPGWCRSDKESIAIFARCILARILVSVPPRRRNERWIKLAVDHLGFPELDIRNYIGHGNSVSLSILIYITRQTFRSGFWTPEMLSPLCNFDAHDSLPELQHEFCGLWNEILDEAWKKGDHTTPVEVLREIRNIFATLHQGPEAPSDQLFASVAHNDEVLRLRSAYPYCRITSHRTIPAPATTSSTVAVAPLHPRAALPRPISAWKRGRPVHPDNSSVESPRNIPIENQSTLGLGSTPRQAGVAYITPRHFLYEDLTPSRTHGSQSPPLNMVPMYMAQEVMEVTDADHSESIGLRTFRVNEDAHEDPRNVPPLLHHPVYSDADLAAANIVPPDLQTPHHTSDTGVTSQAPVTTLHVFHDPDTVEATIMPSTGTNSDLPPSSTVLAITKPCDHTPPHSNTPPSPPLTTTGSVHGKQDQQQLVRTNVSAQSDADIAENISPPGSLTSQILTREMGESNQASEATFCAPSGPDPLPASAATTPSTGPELPINTIPHLTVASPLGDDTEITDPQL